MISPKQIVPKQSNDWPQADAAVTSMLNRTGKALLHPQMSSVQHPQMPRPGGYMQDVSSGGWVGGVRRSGGGE